MRKCVLFTLVVAFGSMSSAAPVPKHLLKTPENPDLTAMQGKWKLTDVAFGGQSRGADFATQLELSLEFRENAMEGRPASPRCPCGPSGRVRRGVTSHRFQG